MRPTAAEGKRMSKAVRKIERMIVDAVVEDAIKAGYELQVVADGEDMTERTTDGAAIIAMLMDLDDAHLIYRKPETPKENHDAWVRFVFGNDGWDVINDYTANLDKLELLKRADAISEEWGG